MRSRFGITSLTLALTLGLLQAHASAAPSAGSESRRTLHVASDGSGQFDSVQAAVDAVPVGNDRRVVIDIGPGTYFERVHIPVTKPKITFRGAGPESTKITYNLHAKSLGPDGEPVGTTGSTGVTISGDGFIAEDLTFANATPRDIAQAVAIKPQADRLVFRNVHFLGWQDTLYPCRGRQYYKDCYIAGGVDFIFGDAVAVFDHCEIRSRRSGYLTAARTPRDARFGYVFLDCRLTRDPGVEDHSVYLGRPWRDYANVTFIRTWMDAHIRPDGWNNWGQPEREKTATYREFGSTGPGADDEARVPWATTGPARAARGVTPRTVLAGDDDWDPTSAGVDPSTAAVR